jgi:hypothetical protein
VKHQWAGRSRACKFARIINRDSIMIRNRWFPSSFEVESAKAAWDASEGRLFMLTSFPDVSRIKSFDVPRISSPFEFISRRGHSVIWSWGATGQGRFRSGNGSFIPTVRLIRTRSPITFKEKSIYKEEILRERIKIEYICLWHEFS